ncbi:MAG: alkylphosphonate utilization protein [Myxococcaceae bacterium]
MSIDQMYVDDEFLALTTQTAPQIKVKDCNGVSLLDGDSVTLIKDLDVKGANFVAKRGLLVKKISLTDDPQLIECRVNGTAIFLKTCFLKKA